MVEAYFNFRQRPFLAAPQAASYFAGRAIEHARQTLARCVERQQGVGLLVGPAGTGKSLLCQVLANQFRASHRVALLADSRLSTRRCLWRSVALALEMPARGRDEDELRLALTRSIESPDDATAGLVLIVDEAQSLPPRLLEELRSLTNSLRRGQPRAQLVLAGSPSLEEHCAHPKLESLNQRIAARCYLQSFGRQETRDYVRSQLAAAAADRRGELFDEAALEAVFRATDGVPRLINQVCDLALTQSADMRIPKLGARQIEEAWAEIQQFPPTWNGSSTASQRQPTSATFTPSTRSGSASTAESSDLARTVPAAAGALGTATSFIEFGDLPDDEPAVASTALNAASKASETQSDTGATCDTGETCDTVSTGGTNVSDEATRHGDSDLSLQADSETDHESAIDSGAEFDTESEREATEELAAAESLEAAGSSEAAESLEAAASSEAASSEVAASLIAGAEGESADSVDGRAWETLFGVGFTETQPVADHYAALATRASAASLPAVPVSAPSGRIGNTRVARTLPPEGTVETIASDSVSSAQAVAERAAEVAASLAAGRSELVEAAVQELLERFESGVPFETVATDSGSRAALDLASPDQFAVELTAELTVEMTTDLIDDSSAVDAANRADGVGGVDELGGVGGVGGLDTLVPVSDVARGTISRFPASALPSMTASPSAIALSATNATPATTALPSASVAAPLTVAPSAEEALLAAMRSLPAVDDPRRWPPGGVLHGAADSLANRLAEPSAHSSGASDPDQETALKGLGRSYLLSLPRDDRDLLVVDDEPTREFGRQGDTASESGSERGRDTGRARRQEYRLLFSRLRRG